MRKIYDYARNGHGPNYIRRRLEDEEISAPVWWNRKKGLRDKRSKFEIADPEHGRFIWDFTTIKEILSNPVYIGVIASQKVVYCFKVLWLSDKKREGWIAVEGMHEPLIDRETYEIVQQKIKDRKRPDTWGNFNLFAGLVKCGQCGNALNIRTANAKSKEKIFICSKYNKYGVAHCSQHRFSYDALYSIDWNRYGNVSEPPLRTSRTLPGRGRIRTRRNPAKRRGGRGTYRHTGTCHRLGI